MHAVKHKEGEGRQTWTSLRVSFSSSLSDSLFGSTVTPPAGTNFALQCLPPLFTSELPKYSKDDPDDTFCPTKRNVHDCSLPCHETCKAAASNISNAAGKLQAFWVLTMAPCRHNKKVRTCERHQDRLEDGSAGRL